MSIQTWQETLVTAQSAGTANTAGTAASALPTHAKITLPNNYFSIGKMVRVWASGSISCAVTTPGTARYDIQFGGVKVFDSLAMNLNIVAKTNVHWFLDVILTCRAIGSGTACNFWPQGTWVSEAVIGCALPTVGTSGIFTLPYNTAPAVGTGCDSTTALTVDLFFTQTVGTGSHTLQEYSFSALN
jgi:hypothetical protein